MALLHWHFLTDITSQAITALREFVQCLTNKSPDISYISVCPQALFYNSAISRHWWL